MAISGWIAVDLDGTLAEYHHWKGPTHIGKPIEPMLDRVRRWLDQGIEVRIFTARVSHFEEAGIITTAVQDWLEALGLPRLAVTCIKDFAMVELWDDRAVQVEMNTGRRIGHSTRGSD